MKINNILFLCCVAIIITFLAGSAEVAGWEQVTQPPAVVQPKMSVKEAITALKESLKDKSTEPVITEIKVDVDGSITLYYTFHGQKNKYYLSAAQVREKEHGDYLRVVRNTPINLILAGATFADLNIPCNVKGEPVVDAEKIYPILNEILLEWKAQKLPALLRNSTSSQLSDLALTLEKGMLKLDLAANKHKDDADKVARDRRPGVEVTTNDLTLARLLEQRKAILIAILGSVKQATAQKATGG